MIAAREAAGADAPAIDKLRAFYNHPDFIAALAARGELAADAVSKAVARYGIDPERPAPWTV